MGGGDVMGCGGRGGRPAAGQEVVVVGGIYKGHRGLVVTPPISWASPAEIELLGCDTTTRRTAWVPAYLLEPAEDSRT